jgi:hypothetical protein
VSEASVTHGDFDPLPFQPWRFWLVKVVGLVAGWGTEVTDDTHKSLHSFS